MPASGNEPARGGGRPTPLPRRPAVGRAIGAVHEKFLEPSVRPLRLSYPIGSPMTYGCSSSASISASMSPESSRESSLLRLSAGLLFFGDAFVRLVFFVLVRSFLLQLMDAHSTFPER
jgi:hypothetical protein